MKHLKRKYNIVMICLCIVGMLALAGVWLIGSDWKQEEKKETTPGRDTKAPVITCDIKNMTIKPNEVLSVAALGLKIQDESAVDYVKFTRIASNKFHTDLPEEEAAKMQELYRKGIALEAEEFIFSYGGIYTITISARDEFYNTSETEFVVKVEEPPVLEVPENFYVADVVEIDFSKYIKVRDFISEKISPEDVVVDTEQLQLQKKGSYEIVFKATDEYGLVTSKTARVQVCAREELQKAINTHEVDIGKDVIIGATNVYDSGYYTADDVEFIKTAMQPCIVSVENNVSGNTGCGFIMEITEEFVTIATSAQLVKKDLAVDVTFFDNAIYSAAVVGASEEREIAFVRIPVDGKTSTTSLTSEYVRNLRTVHMNHGYWKQLSVEEKERLCSQGVVSETIGSPIFDSYGHLMGMVCSESQSEDGSVKKVVSLEELLQYFEIVFKYKVHYQ